MSEELLSKTLNSVDRFAERLMTNYQTKGGGDPRINSTDNLFVLYREFRSSQVRIASLESRLEKAVKLAKRIQEVEENHNSDDELFESADWYVITKLADAILEPNPQGQEEA